MLRPSGIGRYFSAVFLAAWLTGWLIGELVALSFLVVLVRSVAGSVAGLPWPMPGGGVDHRGLRLPIPADHDRYTLNVIDSQDKRTIASEINDEADTVDLGRWLSARTGFPLSLSRQLQ